MKGSSGIFRNVGNFNLKRGISVGSFEREEGVFRKKWKVDSVVITKEEDGIGERIKNSIRGVIRERDIYGIVKRNKEIELFIQRAEWVSDELVGEDDTFGQLMGIIVKEFLDKGEIKVLYRVISGIAREMRGTGLFWKWLLSGGD